MLRVGLTGGIASGKSTVAELFAALGAPIVDTDVVAREVVAPGTPGLEEIRTAFGEAVIAASGELDRRTVRSLVFGDPERRHRLEAILHPRIRAQTLARLESIEAPYVIVVVPLLLETGFSSLVDRILVVDCPRQEQLRRLLARDGITRPEAEAMLDAQLDRETRLASADDVLDNGGRLDATRDRVGELHSAYLTLASERAHERRK
jgi:dephospho-CoA kinase